MEDKPSIKFSLPSACTSRLLCTFTCFMIPLLLMMLKSSTGADDNDIMKELLAGGGAPVIQ